MFRANAQHWDSVGLQVSRKEQSDLVMDVDDGSSLIAALPLLTSLDITALAYFADVVPALLDHIRFS